VPEEILEKPTALTSAEWRTVVQHPRIGQVILEQAAALKDAVPIILHHHERYAGHGYPYGLRANEIPLGARIVSVADAYDAMVHDRPYKRAMSHDQAVMELRRHAGTQFDPEIVELFCDLFADHAPQADLAVSAIAAASAAHGTRPMPLVVPDAAAARARRRRRTDDVGADVAADGLPDGPDAGRGGSAAAPAASIESRTMAPEGSLGLAPGTPTVGSPGKGRQRASDGAVPPSRTGRGGRTPAG
jgi:hypothetical protein